MIINFLLISNNFRLLLLIIILTLYINLYQEQLFTILYLIRHNLYSLYKYGFISFLFFIFYIFYNNNHVQILFQVYLQLLFKDSLNLNLNLLNLKIHYLLDVHLISLKMDHFYLVFLEDLYFYL